MPPSLGSKKWVSAVGGLARVEGEPRTILLLYTMGSPGPHCTYVLDHTSCRTRAEQCSSFFKFRNSYSPPPNPCHCHLPLASLSLRFLCPSQQKRGILFATNLLVGFLRMLPLKLSFPWAAADLGDLGWGRGI